MWDGATEGTMTRSQLVRQLAEIATRPIGTEAEPSPAADAPAQATAHYELFVWLISFRRLIEGISAQGRTVRFDPGPGHRTKAASVVPADRMSRIRRLLSRSRMLYRAVRVVRRRLLKIEARIRYRPWR